MRSTQKIKDYLTEEGRGYQAVKFLSSMALKPIYNRWIRTGSKTILKNHVYHRFTDSFPQILRQKL